MVRNEPGRFPARGTLVPVLVLGFAAFATRLEAGTISSIPLVLGPAALETDDEGRFELYERWVEDAETARRKVPGPAPAFGFAERAAAAWRLHSRTDLDDAIASLLRTADAVPPIPDVAAVEVRLPECSPPVPSDRYRNEFAQLVANLGSPPAVEPPAPVPPDRP